MNGNQAVMSVMALTSALLLARGEAGAQCCDGVCSGPGQRTICGPSDPLSSTHTGGCTNYAPLACIGGAPDPNVGGIYGCSCIGAICVNNSNSTDPADCAADAVEGCFLDGNTVTISDPSCGATFAAALPIPPVLTDANITIHMTKADIPILPGKPTTMWTYGGTFPGPTIRRPSGETTTVTFVNDLPAEAGSMTVHHHGNHSRSTEDGQPEDVHDHANHSAPSLLIPPGGQRTYTWELMEDGEPERAAFQWYHDHRMDVTGRNVWMGLAGMFIVDDAFDSSLPLPKGEFDVPLMITDRQFDADNQIPYVLDPFGVTGDRILVNGAAEPHFDVGDRKYRLRILNASNRRVYDLSLGNGQPLVQIATESGLMQAPVTRQRIELAPAERVEVVVDFAGRLGETITLRNGPTDILQFRVNRDLVEESSVPATLRPLPTYDPPLRTRLWVFSTGPNNHPEEPPDFQLFPLGLVARWTINGKEFDHNRIDACPRLGSTERWLLVTPATEMDHVVHIHDVDSLMVSRNGEEIPVHERALKETFHLNSLAKGNFGGSGKGEVIEVVLKFTDHLGRYMIHCHMLEHEDGAMMAQFLVVPPDGPLPPECPPEP